MNNYKINGLPGFGFAGETGDKGSRGNSTFYAPIKYVDKDGIPNSNGMLYFDDDSLGEKYYVDVEQISTGGIIPQDGDVIIISGDDRVSVHKITMADDYYGEKRLLIISEPMYTIKQTVIPEIHFSASVEKTADKGYVKIYPVVTSSNLENFQINYIYTDNKGFKLSEGTLKDFNYTDIGNTQLTSVYNSNNRLYFYAYYMIRPYKMKKVYLSTINLK